MEQNGQLLETKLFRYNLFKFLLQVGGRWKVGVGGWWTRNSVHVRLDYWCLLLYHVISSDAILDLDMIQRRAVGEAKFFF